jgi:polyisoprenoid-binding protein YceI
MKTTFLLLAIAIIGSANLGFSQKSEVDTKKSNITWTGKKIGGQHEGSISLKEGWVQEQDGKLKKGEFIVDMASITNTDLKDPGYNKKLVGHLKSDDFFGVASHPTAKFLLTESTEFKDNKAMVTGKITIKGITQTIDFTVEKDDKGYLAIVPIDRSKFNVRYGSNSFFDNLGDKAIDDIFTLDIYLELKQ